MDRETAQTTTTVKLPILKQVQTTKNADGTSTTLILGLVTTEEKVQKKNDMKARSMLLMALPNEHPMTFNQYKDARTLFAAIPIRFGAMVAIDGASFDWSYMADDEVPTNMNLMDFSDSEPEFEGYGPKTSNSVGKDISNEIKESPDALLVKELVLDDTLAKKIVFPTITKIEFVRPKQQEKLVRKPVKYAEMYRPNLAVVNVVRENEGNQQLELQEKGVIDSRCSRHMIENMSYLSDTPMETSKPLLKDENAKDVDVHLYRLMIGSLTYLTSSRPDIMFVDSPFNLEAYTDSDYAGASLDRKSTIEGCQFLGRRLISWQCKKKTVVANSTTEVEYGVASN
uniref:Uncharacterized mitochondrial protein AtMg00810-like n=1 Tax=Tanacetum cinerariifolium TaxID=118510 RepID=A0A6L2P989_TANCI|nr:uncharacterized mitochondrial protein AtMg00810-like [Tanacetum cinerariifolium]